MLAGGRCGRGPPPPVCWSPPRCGCGAPLRPPRGVVTSCDSLWWARAPPCAAPPVRWVLAPRVLVPPAPAVLWPRPRPLPCLPPRVYLEATAPRRRIHSLAPWIHHGSGHPHAHRSRGRRAGTAHAVIHSPQQAFSQQSSGAAASRSHSHSSATNMVAAPVMLP